MIERWFSYLYLFLLQYLTEGYVKTGVISAFREASRGARGCVFFSTGISTALPPPGGSGRERSEPLAAARPCAMAGAGSGVRRARWRLHHLFEDEFLQPARSRLWQFGVEQEMSVDDFRAEHPPARLHQ
jgi:hypothetical protein